MSSRWDKQEYEDFLSSDAHSPPPKLTENILSFVRQDLSPPHSLIFIKLLLIQTIVGITTMLFCPQFDLSLTNNYELFHFFHQKFGKTICMAICGGIFVGSGAVAAAFWLKAPEVKKISKSPLLYYFSISSIFLVGFLLLGVETYIEISVAWILGATLMGGMAHFLSKRVRQILLSAAL